MGISKKELSIKIYGGLNTKNPPFSIGDKLKQIWRLDDDGEPIKDGREQNEFMGMRGGLMLLKTLNLSAAYNEDTMSSEVIRLSKKAGFNPGIGGITQLHYKYADRFEVIN